MKRSAITSTSLSPVRKRDESKRQALVALPARSASAASAACVEKQLPSNEIGAINLTPTRDIHMLTGSADRVIKWHKVLGCFCYLEVISTIVSIKSGFVQNQRMMLLRDKGPILKVLYHDNDDDNQFVQVSQQIRCVGYMSGSNTLTALKIRKPTIEEIATLLRHIYVGDFSVSSLIYEAKIKET